jgi:hypothetical protein
MKKTIWYTGNNTQFFDSKPEGQRDNVHSFTIDTDSGEVTGLNLQSSVPSSQQRQPQSA